jgi:alkylated DNA repair dioxygenase AlkB
MHYVQNFLCDGEARSLLDWAECSTNVDWQSEKFLIYGRQVTAPRRLAWFGDADINYRYTGLDHLARGWPDLLLGIRARVAELSSTSFNFVLFNRYANGKQYMGWHRDNEVNSAPTIASLSLGATRRFRFRSGTKGTSQAIDLEHGSLLVFDGDVRHTLTATKQDVGVRVNLTFRNVLPCK